VKTLQRPLGRLRQQNRKNHAMAVLGLKPMTPHENLEPGRKCLDWGAYFLCK
jgi:hypothetical protein